MAMQQELLPFDKLEYADRCQAIERLGPEETGLSIGQLKKVRDFLKRVFKHKWSAPSGTITFVRCADPVPGAKNLAIEFEVTGRTIDNWLRWSIDAGLVETSVSADRYGRRQTTLEFRWLNIFRLAENAMQRRAENAMRQRESGWTNAKRFPNQRETVSEPKRNGFATKAKRFPNQSETVSLSCITNGLPILPPLTKEPEAAAAVLEASGEVERILATRLWPGMARRLAPLCDAATARDVIAEFDHAHAQGLLKSPGAIAARLETGQWPQDRVRTAAELRAANEAAERRQAAERAAAVANRRQLDQAAAAAERIEAECGPKLDAMPPAELDEFARGVLGDLLFGHWKSGRLAGDCRLLLLTAIDGAGVLT